jgi:beta-glucosidase
VSLQPGETKKVSMKLYTEQFGYYFRESVPQWCRDAGKYMVKVGASSADIRLQQQVTLEGAPVLNRMREHYFSETTVTE